MSSSYALGITFIILVAIIWSASSILAQFLFHNLNFDSPFLLTYIGSSLFTIFIPMRLIWESLGLAEKTPWRSPIYSDPSTHTSNGNTTYSSEIDYVETVPIKIMQGLDNEMDVSTPGEQEDSISHIDHIVIASKIALVWFLSNYGYNLSLDFTSITSSTVLASTGSVFTYIFSIMEGHEQFTKLKLSGVILSIVGSIATSYRDLSSDSDGPEEDMYVDALWGDLLGLVAAIGYGGYTVLIRKLCPSDESLMSMQLLLGYIGAINMMIFAPGAIWILYTNFDFGGKSIVEYDTVNVSEQKSNITWFILLCVVVKGLFDNVLSDYLWARAVILTSATVATVGVGLTIPLALFSDAFIMDLPNAWNISGVFGAVSVLVGFALVNMSELEIETRGYELVCQSDLEESTNVIV